MGSASPCSASYVLLALIGFTGFFISPSLSLPAGRVAAPRATVVVPVLDICRTYVDGNEEITLYCKDGLSCGENDQGETKCFADVDPMSGQDSDGAGGEGMEEFEYFNNPQNEERAATEPERKSEPEKKQASPGGWDCESAGEYERLTSGWYYACAINKVPTRNSNYKPKIDPAELSRSAKQKCQGQGDFDACVGNAKQEMILAADPGIRDKCSGQSGMDFIVCVDQMYVYGRAREPQLRDALRKEAASGESANEGPRDQSKVDTGPKAKGGCPPGQGAKPDPTAFGAWTCQPLHSILFGKGPNAINTFETRVDDVAQDAVDSALENLRDSISDSNEEQCRAEAIESVRAIMTGGDVDVSPPCRDLVGASKGEFTHYLTAHVYTDPALEEVLNWLQPNGGAASGGAAGEGQRVQPGPAPPQERDQASSQSKMPAEDPTLNCAWFCENAHSVVCDEDNRIDMSMSGGDIEMGKSKYGCETVNR